MPTGVYDRRRSKVTPEMRAQILEEIKTGNQTYVELGKKYKLHHSTFNKMKRADEQKRNVNAPHAPVSGVPETPSKRIGPQFGSGKYEHLVPQMQALRAENLSYREIGEKLGVGKGSVATSAVGYYLNPKRKFRIQSSVEGVQANGHEQLDTRFLVGFGCAELERTLTAIAQRLGLSPNLLRQGFSRLLGSSAFR